MHSCREISSGGAAEAGNEAMQSFDFIEIDAASNRGIDDVRSIRAEATVQPARDATRSSCWTKPTRSPMRPSTRFSKRWKSRPSGPFHAGHHAAGRHSADHPLALPALQLSRRQVEDILAQLQMIAEKEGLDAEEGALALLAEAGDGSMRDALSIMDQAIASAPIEAGRPLLSTAQIRELMGSVPNAVYERLLEAVAAGQSAELMTQLNLLLNAGHNPSSLARQMARYLRNTLMAKLGGAETELLQISGDERARAARTAAALHRRRDHPATCKLFCAPSMT